nr:SLC13 family permease [Akkermansiaceae bacterium]
MNQLFQLKDFVNLSRPRGRILRRSKAPVAVLAIAAFMLLGALVGFGVIPNLPVVGMAMGAALFVLVTRCIDPQEAYEAIEWK